MSSWHNFISQLVTGLHLEIRGQSGLMGGQICSSDLKVLPTVVDKNNGVGAESGNDFHFPDIALDPVHFRSIFVRFPSVASDWVDIRQIGNKT